MTDVIIKIIHSGDIRFAVVIEGILYSIGLKCHKKKWIFYMIDKPYVSKKIHEVYEIVRKQDNVMELFEALAIPEEEIVYKVFSDKTTDEELYFLFH